MAACQAGEAASALVEQVCLQVLDYEFCQQTLNGNPETAGADRYKLAAIAFQMAYQDARDSPVYIDSLLNDPSGPSKDPGVRGHLQWCRNDFYSATSQFAQAGDDVFSKIYNHLGIYATAASDDADDCQSVFGRRVSLLDSEIRNLRVYAQIGEAVAKLFL